MLRRAGDRHRVGHLVRDQPERAADVTCVHALLDRGDVEPGGREARGVLGRRAAGGREHHHLALDLPKAGVAGGHDRGEAARDVEPVQAAAGAAGAGTEVGQDGLADVRGRVAVAEDPVGELAGETGHLRADRGHVDARRTLGRLHLELKALDGEDLPLEGHGLAGQDASQDRDVLAHRAHRPLVTLSVPALDVAARLQPHPQQQTAAGQLVQRRRLQRHGHGRAAPDPDHARTETEAGRLHRDRRRRTERVAERDLREPGRAEPTPLGPFPVVGLHRRRQRLDEDVEGRLGHGTSLSSEPS